MLLLLTRVKPLYIQSSAHLSACGRSRQGGLFGMLCTPLCPTMAKLHTTASPAQNAFLGDPTSGCKHIAKWITAPGEHNDPEMEDTCKNRSGLLQREPKATADVLFISVLITHCCEMVLWTGKEKLPLIAHVLTAHKTAAPAGRQTREQWDTPSWGRHGIKQHMVEGWAATRVGPISLKPASGKWKCTRILQWLKQTSKRCLTGLTPAVLLHFTPAQCTVLTWHPSTFSSLRSHQLH